MDDRKQPVSLFMQTSRSSCRVPFIVISTGRIRREFKSSLVASNAESNLRRPASKYPANAAERERAKLRRRGQVTCIPRNLSSIRVFFHATTLFRQHGKRIGVQRTPKDRSRIDGSRMNPSSVRHRVHSPSDAGATFTIRSTLKIPTISRPDITMDNHRTKPVNLSVDR